MNERKRIVGVVGAALASAGLTLQGIGIAAVHYQMAIQIVAVFLGFAGMVAQGISKPLVMDPKDK
jgi:hypothetical protein